MSDNQGPSGGGHGGGKGHFFVDGTRYEVNDQTLNGAAIKRMANVPENYQLFLEGDGNDPDQQISDSQSVTIHGKPKHFYSVPPATFGGHDAA